MHGCPLHEQPSVRCISCGELAVKEIHRQLELQGFKEADLPPDDDTILRIASGADDPPRATDICAKAAELVGGERDRTHGSKRKNFENIAAGWNAYLFGMRKDPSAPLTPADVGHMMVMLKVARTQHGAYNPDDYIDIAGYAGCAGEIAAQEVAGG